MWIYMAYFDKEGKATFVEHLVWDLTLFINSKRYEAERLGGTAYRISAEDFTERTGRKVFP